MRSIVALLCLTLTGCNALGGISPETINTLAHAGGGCIAVESLVMGKGIMMVAGTDKGALGRGGGHVAIAAACGGVNIRAEPHAIPYQPVLQAPTLQSPPEAPGQRPGDPQPGQPTR